MADNWSNKDNAAYYEAISVETLRSFAVIGGFENGCDIDIIYNNIKDRKSIFEVGAAYGRVLANLIKRGYGGELYAIERSSKLFNHLKENFVNEVTLYNADINSFNPSRKFDVILWLWSNISDFPKSEHLPILSRLRDWLMPDGLFVLDTILHNVKLADSFTMDGQSYVEKSDFGTAYGYIPTRDEITEYAQKLGFEFIKQIDYKTNTGRPRIIHLLSHQPIFSP